MNDAIEVQIRITSVGYENPWKSAMLGVAVDDAGIRNDARKVFSISANKKLLPVEVEVGQVWKVRGLSTTRKVDKGDYVIDEVRVLAEGMEFIFPENREAFIRFVADQKDFRGIGEVKARRLWNLWGENLIPIIKSGDRAAFSNVLSEDAITGLFHGFKKYTALEHFGFFVANGIPQGVIQRIFKRHKADIKERIQEDPYRLLSFGLTWAMVDDIAQVRFAKAENSKIRLSAAIEECLSEESRKTGNTVIPQEALRKALKRLLKSNNLVSQALMQEHDTGAFIVSEKGYHSAGHLIMESTIAKRLTVNRYEMAGSTNIIASESFKRAQDGLGFDPTLKQIKAVSNAHLHYVSIVIGGAGTGKTSTLRLVTQTLQAEGVEIHCIALSGRAAKRMSEATGGEALTIAKFLRNPPLADDKPQMVVIDEASMLDTQTMFRILTHVCPNVRIVLVGDADQLPPIGPGHVLRDLVSSGVFGIVELDVVKRQRGDSGIPDYSRSIRDGVIPHDLSAGSVTFHPVGDTDINETSVQIMSEDPETTIIVAASYSSLGGGIDSLNELAQRKLNKGSERWEFDFNGERRHLKIYKNDPVIFTANDYEARVQNGTLGRLNSIDQEEGTYGTVKTLDGEMHSVTQAMLESLRPAYAVSLHKAQGSQFRRVIVPLSKSKLIDRNWLYTAVTRAEQELHIVGSEEVFRKAVERESTSSKRQTYLTELLRSKGSLSPIAGQPETVGS